MASRPGDGSGRGLRLRRTLMATFSSASVQPLEAYASTTSVPQGGLISFHVSVSTPAGGSVTAEIYRARQLRFSDKQFGTQADSIYNIDYRSHVTVRPGQTPVFTTSFSPLPFVTPTDAARNGCGWPAAFSWLVPDVPSSMYVARFEYRDHTTYALFVIRPAEPGASRILCQLSFNTYQAYNPWGGFSFYGPPISLDFSPQLSFDRPTQLWDFILYDEPIVTWLERHYDVEFCSNVDLHSDPSLLSPYQLFISCGHDEYWSGVMRDRVEAFAASGGNVMFLTGNTCYRPVDVGDRVITKLADAWLLVGRPEATTTGLSWGAGHWSTALPAKGYTVQEPSHWMFEGTGLAQGDLLGEAEGIIGYEADAAVYDLNGNPTAPTPSDFVTVANANLAEWLDFSGRTATMGLYRRNGRGVVVNVGTTGWGQGLLADTGNVHRVTANLVNCLRFPFDSGNLLRYRDANLDGTGDVGGGETVWRGGWNEMANVVSGENDVLYAVSAGGDLLWFGDLDVSRGKAIGHGGWNSLLSVFGGDEGILYAITQDGDLLWYQDQNRDGTGDVGGGLVIGQGGWSDFSEVFAGGDGVIYAITPGGELQFFRDEHRDGTGNVADGQTIGSGVWNDFVHVCSGGDGVIYAVSQAGDLLYFRDDNRDGTGDVGVGRAIGHGGWDRFARIFSAGDGVIYAITAGT
jgi:hypothetical protein